MFAALGFFSGGGQGIDMRTPRIKAAEGTDGMYHCTSRIVGGAFLLGGQEKEVFVRMMWREADFLGIEVLDYVVMSNHYHQLVRTPGEVKLSDEQLLEKLHKHYGPRSPEVRRFEAALGVGGDYLEGIRKLHVKRMGDVSEFQKVLKQRFSKWYNRQNERKGTLWMERFGSVLVEDTLHLRKILAAYIDLNPLRAEMVEDPARYRFCGYGAAMGGDRRCCRGIQRVMGIDNWEEAAAQYRIYVMKRGHVAVAGKKGKVSREQLLEVLGKGGHLPRCELIRLRLRYFSEGLVLGSERFVEEVFAQYRSHFGEKRRSGARAIHGWPDSRLKVMRELRVDPVS